VIWVECSLESSVQQQAARSRRPATGRAIKAPGLSPAARTGARASTRDRGAARGSRRVAGARAPGAARAAMLLRVRVTSFLAGFGLASAAAFWQLHNDINHSSEYLAAQARG
jgi:hypothetical protein